MNFFKRKNTTAITPVNNKPYHITIHSFGPDSKHTFRTFDYTNPDKARSDWNRLVPILKKKNILGEYWEEHGEISIFSSEM